MSRKNPIHSTDYIDLARKIHEGITTRNELALDFERTPARITQMVRTVHPLIQSQVKGKGRGLKQRYVLNWSGWATYFAKNYLHIDEEPEESLVELLRRFVLQAFNTVPHTTIDDLFRQFRYAIATPILERDVSLQMERSENPFLAGVASLIAAVLSVIAWQAILKELSEPVYSSARQTIVAKRT